jgi:hypothetical protein
MMCLALGTTKSLLKVSAANLVVFVPMAYLSRRWGMEGFAVCWSASRYFIALAVLAAATRQIQTGLRIVWKELALLTLVTAASVGAMGFVKHFWPTATYSTPTLLVRFVAVGTMGTLVYIALLWLLLSDSVKSALRTARGGGPTQSPQAAAQAESTATIPAESQEFLFAAMGNTLDVAQSHETGPINDDGDSPPPLK